jgi:hypothetical protein
LTSGTPGHEDVAVLKPFNPIPQVASEREEEIDPCIFEGFLRNEKDSMITLTGCPLTDTFQVQHLTHRGHSNNTLHSREASRQCHQMTQGEEGGVNKMSLVIFLSIFELNFTAKIYKKLCFL